MISLELDDRKLAKTYDEVSDSQFDSGRKLVDLLSLKYGDAALDLGCGTGRLARFIADRLGAHGRLIGIDPLPERIAVANEKNQYPNVTFRVGAAEELREVPNGSIDAVYLSSVFHWIRDKARALAEIHRVLKPNGRVGLTTNAKELAPLTTLAAITARVFARAPYNRHVEPEDFAPIEHGVTTTELIQLLIAAGLVVQSIRVESIVREFKSGEALVGFAESSMFGNYTGKLPEELRPTARSELANEFDGLKRTGVIATQLYTLFAVATKPAPSATYS